MKEAAIGLRGINRSSACLLMKTSMNPETMAPAVKKGTASIKMPRKMVTKVGKRPLSVRASLPPGWLKLQMITPAIKTPAIINQGSQRAAVCLLALSTISRGL